MSTITLTILNRPLTVNESWTIKKLYEEVGRMKGANIDSFTLNYGGRPLMLEQDGRRTLEEYHFSDMEELVFVERAHGGGGLQPLDNHVRLTKEPCCILMTDDDEWRAKLACCGQPIGVEAVRRMHDVTLRDGGYEVPCPSCQTPMEWFVVRHILSSEMSKNELLDSLKKINANFLNKRQREVRRCTGCGTYRQRDFTKWFGNVYRVACDECTRKAGHEVDFCWICGQRWRSGGKGCGNWSCDGATGELRTLQECPTKTIGSVDGCPDTRACPECGMLISHIDRCKHIVCKCGCAFCFVCLKVKSSNWACGSPGDACPVAPRQTSIPNY